MAKVIFIGSDKSIFEKESLARARMIEYGTLFEELHIVIFTIDRRFESMTQISSNVWIYPTKSLTRWRYPFDGSMIAKNIIEKQGGSDWVISAQDPFEAGLATTWAARKTGAKIHIQIHTDFLSPFFKRQSFLNILRLKIASITLPQAQGIRVVSPRIKSSLETKNFKLKADPVVLPIFLEQKSLSNISPYDYKKNCPTWNFTILSVGRLEPEKNFELAIQLMKVIYQTYPHIGLAIIGEGSLKNKLKNLAGSLGLSGNICFLGGSIKDLTSYYFGANLYLQTSNYEGFGLSVAEAAYSGLPVVMTDVGIANWFLKNEENSKICPVGDKKCLTDSLTDLIENNQLRERIIGNLKNNLGFELSITKSEYLQKYKENIESCFSKR